MDIKEISQLKTVLGPELKTSEGHGEVSFADTLKNYITKVDNLHKEADEAILDLAAGKSKNIHETMLAIQKADISFRLMMQVRNKIIEAYQEVMRMSV